MLMGVAMRMVVMVGMSTVLDPAPFKPTSAFLAHIQPVLELVFEKAM